MEYSYPFYYRQSFEPNHSGSHAAIRKFGCYRTIKTIIPNTFHPRHTSDSQIIRNRFLGTITSLFPYLIINSGIRFSSGTETNIKKSGGLKHIVILHIRRCGYPFAETFPAPIERFRRKGMIFKPKRHNLPGTVRHDKQFWLKLMVCHHPFRRIMEQRKRLPHPAI